MTIFAKLNDSCHHQTDCFTGKGSKSPHHSYTEAIIPEENTEPSMCIDQAIDTLLDTVDNVNVTLDNNMQNWVAHDAYQAPSLNERVQSKDVEESNGSLR